MVAINRKKHHGRTQPKSITLILGALVGIIFVLNLVVLHVAYTSLSSSSNTTAAEGTNPSSSSSSSSQSKRQQKGQKQRRDCPDYGCPRYPPELTPQLDQILLDAFRGAPASDESSNVTLSDFSSDWFAMLTQQGKSHVRNQDRGLFISPFLSPGDGSDDEDNHNTPSYLMAIFDGHGRRGHWVAQEVVEAFPKLLASKLRAIEERSHPGDGWWSSSNDVAVTAALNETFVEVNAGGTTPNFYLGGCTASVTLRYGSKLYFANAGDSQTILVSTSGPGAHPSVLSIEYMTRKDKASLPDERDRITRLGGRIHVSGKDAQDTRVIVYSEKMHDLIGLAMSRSLGDWEWKLVGVTAEPIVDIMDLSKLMGNKNGGKDQKHYFVIAASDGIWDVRRREFYAEQFAAGFGFRTVAMDRGVKPELRPLAKLHEVMHIVTPSDATGYLDDITAIVTKL